MALHRIARALAVSLLATACGGAPASHVDGTIGGMPFTVADAVSATAHPLTGPSGSLAYVELSSVQRSCDATAVWGLPRGMFFLDLTLFVANYASSDRDVPPAPGDYQVEPHLAQPPAGNDAIVAYGQISPTCGLPTILHPALASSGTLHIASIDASGISGSGDLSFPSGDHVTVEFQAPACAAFQTAENMGLGASCQ